jgi:peptide deformylase
MVKILTYPDKSLRQVSDEIKQIDDTFLRQVEILKEELAKGENAAGLAAIQLGIAKRFFGIKKSHNKIEIYINPIILKTFGERVYPVIVKESPVDNSGKEMEDFLEGCLSVPDYFGTVKRYLKIEVEWKELKGGKFVSKREKLTGFEAIVWQHEFDHLDGKLFIDYIKKEGGKFYKWNGKKMVAAEINKIIKEEF